MNGNAKEYALAMFAIALENESMAQVHDDLDVIREVIDENPEYIEYLVNPAVSKSERTNSLSAVFEGKVCEDVFAFLNILCDHGDTYILGDCVEEFNAMYEDYMRFSKAVVTSAVELSDDQKSRLITKISAVTGKRVEAEYVIDKALIGGISVEVDGKLFDGSVRKNLNNIKEVIS